jgi:hypothetical protein
MKIFLEMISILIFSLPVVLIIIAIVLKVKKKNVVLWEKPNTPTALDHRATHGQIPTAISIALAFVTSILFKTGNATLAWIVIVVGGLTLALVLESGKHKMVSEESHNQNKRPSAGAKNDGMRLIGLILATAGCFGLITVIAAFFYPFGDGLNAGPQLKWVFLCVSVAAGGFLLLHIAKQKEKE